MIKGVNGRGDSDGGGWGEGLGFQNLLAWLEQLHLTFKKAH